MRACIALLASAACFAAAAQDGQTWTFNAPRGDGYKVDLEAVTPPPGTPLLRGKTVEFEVSVRHRLDIADQGTVALVIQDHQDQSLTAAREQVSVTVGKGPGTSSLRDSIVVPESARELVLFIPLVPAGMTETTGEVTIRYPVTSDADGPQYMPYPLAEISTRRWVDYHNLVQEYCGESRRAFPGEYLEVFECPANSLHLAFTIEGHPAHPSWITRQVRGGTVDQIGYFAGDEAPFAELFRSYLALTDRTLKKMRKEASD